MRRSADSRCSVFLVGLLVGGLLASDGVPIAAQDPRPDVEVVVTPAAQSFDTAEGLRFSITLRNTGAGPVLLNGGALLGNGRQGWHAIACVLHPSTGAGVHLGLRWQMGPVGGRIYFLGVPLRPGDSHTLTVTPADYSRTEALQPGRYSLQCTFTGTQSTYRDTTEMPGCWEGVAVSKPVSIDIARSKRP